MSTGNGEGRIVSLEAARINKTRKGNDFITVAQAQQMVVEETTKVHAFYLEQIPPFVARMIQDALLSYGLIKPVEGVDIAPVEAPVVSANAGGDAAPADSNAPAEPAA